MAAAVSAVMEPCPPELAHLDSPRYGGSLFYHPDTGLAGCANPECGWSGVPTLTGGEVPAVRVDARGPYRMPPADGAPAVISTRCPACELPEETDREYRRERDRHTMRRSARQVPRNQPCPCGSGVKAKRCACDTYTT